MPYVVKFYIFLFVGSVVTFAVAVKLAPLGLFVNLSLAFSAACLWSLLADGFLINRTACERPESEHQMGITEPLTVEHINQQMDQLAREIGTLDPDDSRRPDLIEEMSRLSMLLAELRKRQRDN